MTESTDHAEDERHEQFMRKLNEMDSKLDKVWYLLVGNGTPGLCEKVRIIEGWQGEHDKGADDMKQLLLRNAAGPIITAFVMLLFGLIGVGAMARFGWL